MSRSHDPRPPARAGLLARWVFATLVVLGLGTVLRHGTVLLHDHGEEGAHLHVGAVAEQARAEHLEPHEHPDHADERADADDEGLPAAVPASHEHAPHSDGVLLVLPAPVRLAAPRCGSDTCPPLAPAADDVRLLGRMDGAGEGARPRACGRPPGAPPSAKLRSGTAALLTTSRALLL